MRVSAILTACGFAVLAAASASPEAHSPCGWPNGNCYDNGCKGELSPDRITCTAGPYRGCQCGYGCGSNTGQCDENDCDGKKNRCTKEFLGCSCLGP